jgi:hypothetical protein
MVETIYEILEALGTRFLGRWAEIIGGYIPPSPGICTPADQTSHHLAYHIMKCSTTTTSSRETPYFQTILNFFKLFGKGIRHVILGLVLNRGALNRGFTIANIYIFIIYALSFLGAKIMR